MFGPRTYRNLQEEPYLSSRTPRKPFNILTRTVKSKQT